MIRAILNNNVNLGAVSDNNGYGCFDVRILNNHREE